jgi:8-oxo-dGTP pyrophosphatase MutT (NUDIX family)
MAAPPRYNDSMMHRLQQHILSQLIHHSDRRYADLKPAAVEGNLFMYHLKHLIKQGYVAKRADGRYGLTAEGHRYADRLSLATLTPRAQPKIVTLLVCRDEAGRYLLWRRRRQPLLGRVGFPHGKIHLGETIADAAQRELREKTGLAAATLHHRGDGYLTYRQDGEPVSQIFFHLFVGEGLTGELAGEAFWAPPTPAADVLPSVGALLELLEHHPAERFFAELAYDLV